MYACEKTGGAITSSVTISQNLCPRVVLETNPSSVTSGMWTCGSLRCSAEPCSGIRKRRCGVGHNSKFVGSEHVGSNVAPSISCPVSIILGHAKFLLLAPSSSETIVTWEIFRGFFLVFLYVMAGSRGEASIKLWSSWWGYSYLDCGGKVKGVKHRWLRQMYVTSSR